MIPRLTLFSALIFTAGSGLLADQNQPPTGFESLFDGKSLDGWWGAKTEDPRETMALSPEQLATKKAASAYRDATKEWVAAKKAAAKAKTPFDDPKPKKSVINKPEETEPSESAVPVFPDTVLFDTVPTAPPPSSTA